MYSDSDIVSFREAKNYILSGDIAKVMSLMEKNGDLGNNLTRGIVRNHTDGDFGDPTTIKVALQSGKPEMVSFLMENGAKVFGARIEDFNHLMCVAIKNNRGDKDREGRTVIDLLLDNLDLNKDTKFVNDNQIIKRLINGCKNWAKDEVFSENYGLIVQDILARVIDINNECNDLPEPNVEVLEARSLNIEKKRAMNS